MEVEARDCRGFSKRSPYLAGALRIGSDTDSAPPVPDDYGVSVRATLASLVDSVATNVAPLFDQYLIADQSGRVLYSADGDGFRYRDVVGAPSMRGARLDFVNHVNVKELVSAAAKQEPSVVADRLAQLGLRSDGDLERFGVHSRVENVQVADITLQAFVHPFEVEGLEALPNDDGVRDRSAVLYMIGVVDRASLSSESIRLRLSLVASALLIVGVSFSLLALLWLWTGGDRMILTFRHLALFLVTGLTAMLLLTLFAMHLVTGTADDLALDQAIEEVSHRVREDFKEEFKSRMTSLAEATGIMLRAGEAKARRVQGTNALTRQGAAALIASAEIVGSNIREDIESAYHCRADPGDVIDPLAQYPKYDLAFLMDGRGVQWQCLSYRLFDTRPIDLSFREYFRYPNEGRLWRSAELSDIPFFVQRVTSILDGTTETVLAAEPSALCRVGEGCGLDANKPEDAGKLEQLDDLGSAAIIGRLHSLEETILPPHIRIAVVENESGRTLFHSVGTRSLATNFIRETEAEKTLLALVDSASSGFVDLEYYGTSIRAFVQPLAQGLPWTLITYRGHELTDTLNILAVSATAAYMIASLVSVAFLLVLAGLLDRWAMSRVPWWRETRDVAIAAPMLWDLTRWLLAITVSAVLLLVLVVALEPSYGGWYAIAVTVTGPSALGILIWRRVREYRRSGQCMDRGDRSRQRGQVIALLLIGLAVLAVLPTIGWYENMRGHLGLGLTEYLHSSIRDAIIAKCERQTAFARRYKGTAVEGPANGVFTYGWTLLPLAEQSDSPDSLTAPPAPCAVYPDGAARLASLELPPGTSDNLVQSSDMLLAVSGFSGLGSDIAVRSATQRDPGSVSPANILTTLLGRGPRPDRPMQAGLRVSDVSMLIFTALSGLLLVWIITVSVSDRVLGMRLRLGRLPGASIDPLPRSWRRSSAQQVRACLIHRSEKLWGRFLSGMVRVDGWQPRRARWTGEGIDWEGIDWRNLSASETATNDQPMSAELASTAAKRDDDDNRVLYVVEGLERFIVDAEARDGLLNELEKLARSNAGILIWSRIIPGTWLANLTDGVSGDLASVTAQLELTSRWSQVLGPFNVRRLEDRRRDKDEAFARSPELTAELKVSEEQYKRVRHTMLREAEANPELFDLAASTVHRLCTNSGTTEGDLSALALRSFRASAASHFHTIWAASSRGERLQLLSLAGGGFANPAQTVTLSSLANRGLITTEGTVRLHSKAFQRFIIKDLDHDSLLRWRDEGHGNIWKSIWPPIVLVAILAVAFLVSSTPEAVGPLVAILAAGLGAVPVIGSLVRSMKDLVGARSDPAAR